MYKTSLIFADCRVVVKAAKRMTRLHTKAKAATILKKANESIKCNCEARKAHVDWVEGGRLVDEDGNPKLNQKDSHTIVKLLL